MAHYLLFYLNIRVYLSQNLNQVTGWKHRKSPIPATSTPGLFPLRKFHREVRTVSDLPWMIQCPWTG
jgi:hypothetical protein